MEIPDLDYKDLKGESLKTILWEDQVKQLEKQYNEDTVVKNIRQQRIDIIESAIPVSINYDYSYIYDEETEGRLKYLEKILIDYIMQNYINPLGKISCHLGE